METFNLNINGKTHRVDVDPETPMLWVLRDHLKLKGTKYGCGIGQCGACIIHLNGKPANSCIVPVSAIGDQRVTTIEGLSANGDHPLQAAWVKHNVPQCGYCQAGQIMTAAALLNENSNPTDEEIEVAMSRNICRCGTYTRINQAIKSVSES